MKPLSSRWRPRRAGAITSLIVAAAWTAVGSAAEPSALDCVIAPSVLVDVSTPVPGTLSEVGVDRSDRVTKGQIIARLNSEVEQAAVDLARAKATLDSEISIAEVNLTFDEERNHRLAALYDVAVASSQDKDEAARNLALSREKVRHAKELRKLRHLELRMAEAQLNQKMIRSPIEGVVVQRFKSVSERVEDQPILRIAQLHPLHVEAIVPMEMFGQVRTGMRAEVYSESFAKNPQTATVSVVDRMGDAASGTFGVRLELPNPDYQTPAGVKCNVRIAPAALQAEHTAPPVEQGGGKPPREGAPDPSTLIMKVGHVPAADPGATANPPACTSLGPYDTREASQVVLDALAARHIAYRLREVPPKATTILLATSQADREASERLMARLRAAGLEDIALIRGGRYQGRISLGVYRNEGLMRLRAEHLAGLGFETEPQPLTRRGAGWWVDLEAPGDGPEAADLEEILHTVGQGPALHPHACPMPRLSQHGSGAASLPPHPDPA